MRSSTSGCAPCRASSWANCPVAVSLAKAWNRHPSIGEGSPGAWGAAAPGGRSPASPRPRAAAGLLAELLARTGWQASHVRDQLAVIATMVGPERVNSRAGKRPLISRSGPDDAFRLHAVRDSSRLGAKVPNV